MLEDLDLVEEEDQFTHLLTLEDAGDPENLLSMLTIVFEFVCRPIASHVIPILFLKIAQYEYAFIVSVYLYVGQ